jgi:hypothetical protein
MDSGTRDPVTAGDTNTKDASKMELDAAVDCVLRAGTCPSGCLGFDAYRYNQQRMCIENVREVVGCVPSERGIIDDPRCALEIATGEIFRVPYSFLGSDEEPPGPRWTSCSTKDTNFVSSTVTPACDDLDDGGIYDGAP